ncbi:NAD-dependent malic enzyme 4 [Bacillus cereus Rock4-18]|nr:NAD-dependent malic enzyme 4 [Bacillus cereus Rock4-18]
MFTRLSFFKGKLRNYLYYVLHKEKLLHEEEIIEVYVSKFSRS